MFKKLLTLNNKSSKIKLNEELFNIPLFYKELSNIAKDSFVKKINVLYKNLNDKTITDISNEEFFRYNIIIISQNIYSDDDGYFNKIKSSKKEMNELIKQHFTPRLGAFLDVWFEIEDEDAGYGYIKCSISIDNEYFNHYYN